MPYCWQSAYGRTGASECRAKQPGLKGLCGISFLMDINGGKQVSLEGNVVVVGGGNVAIDVARTALRAGAGGVELFCLESREQMPAWDHEVKEALAEGVVIHPSWGPKNILHEGGSVTGIEFVRCTSVFDASGCFNPAYDQKITRTVEAKTVLLAIGLSAQNPELERLGILERGRVNADFESMQTSDPKIFAAGDGAFGASAIVYAIHHGHRAAYYVNAFLEGRESRALSHFLEHPTGSPDPGPALETLAREEQIVDECILLARRARRLIYWDTAKRQAARCLRCDTETGMSDYSRRTARAHSRHGPHCAGRPPRANRNPEGAIETSRQSLSSGKTGSVGRSRVFTGGFDQARHRPLSRAFGDVVKGIQVVQSPDAMPRLKQSLAKVRPDKTRAARDQEIHRANIKQKNLNFKLQSLRLTFWRMTNEPLLKLELPGVKKLKSGKVREVFDLGDRLLFVATDRISAFDCVMPNGIPRKGEVLTQISYFWFDQTAGLVPNHLSAKAGDPLPPELQKFSALLARRSMVVQKDPAAGHRMRRARLSVGVGLEGLPEDGMRLRH